MPQNKLHLTGADCFYEAILKVNDPSHLSNSRCAIYISFKHKVDVQALEDRIVKNEHIQFLNKIDGICKNWSSAAYWRQTNRKKVVIEQEGTHCKTIQEVISNEKISCSEWMSFKILSHVKSEKSYLIFYWNHVFMDGFGAELLLQNLLLGKHTCMIRPNPNPVKVSKFLDGKKYIQSFQKRDSHQFFQEVHSEKKELHFLDFTGPELQTLKKQAQEVYPLGGVFFLFFAKIALALVDTFNTPRDESLWASVPHDKRKVGAKGPILGNQNTFLFFDIDVSMSVIDLAKRLHQQMKTYTQEKCFKKVDTLINSLCYFNPGYNAKKIKGNNSNLGSFLFTQAPRNNSFFEDQQAFPVASLFNLPPCPDNPGLTFSLHETHEGYTLIFQHKKENTLPLDVDRLKKRLKFV